MPRFIPTATGVLSGLIVAWIGSFCGAPAVFVCLGALIAAAGVAEAMARDRDGEA